MKAFNRAVWALVLPFCLFGCGHKGSGSGDTGGGGPAGNAKGIDAAGNDAAVVALAKKVLAGCKWSDYGFAYDCADRKAWDDSELTKDGKADATLVSMLEDQNEQIRWLAAMTLSNKGDKYLTDKLLADRVLDAALAEKSKSVARNMGNAAGRIKLGDVGLVDKAKPLGKVPTLKELRLGFIGAVQYANRDAYYTYTVDLAKTDTDHDIRDAAMSSFWTGTPNSKVADVCALWLDLSHDPNDEELAAHAAYFDAFFPFDNGCRAQWDTMLSDIEKRAKAGTAKSSNWGFALGYLWDQKAATPAQKKKAIAIAKMIADNKNNGTNARAYALDAVAREPANKSYIQKFTKDPDSFLKSHSEDLIKRMNEKKK